MDSRWFALPTHPAMINVLLSSPPLWSCGSVCTLRTVGWLVGWLLNVPAISVSQGRICSDNFTCCQTEIEVADPTFYLTQSQYTDTGPTSPSADPKTPSAWQGSHWSANFQVTGMTRPGKKSRRKRDSNPGSSAFEADALTTRPARRDLKNGRPGDRSPFSRTSHTKDSLKTYSSGYRTRRLLKVGQC